jgi:hypothetical protein
MFGTTFYHFFNTTIDPAHGISAFKVTVLRGQSTQIFSNGGAGYPIEDIAVFLSHETIIGPDGALSLFAAVSASIIYPPRLWVSLGLAAHWGRCAKGDGRDLCAIASIW